MPHSREGKGLHLSPVPETLNRIEVFSALAPTALTVLALAVVAAVACLSVIPAGNLLLSLHLFSAL